MEIFTALTATPAGKTDGNLRVRTLAVNSGTLSVPPTTCPDCSSPIPEKCETVLGIISEDAARLGLLIREISNRDFLVELIRTLEAGL